MSTIFLHKTRRVLYHRTNVNQFLAENPRAVRTEGQARIEFEKFLATLGGNREVSAITKADGRAYKDELMQVRKLHLVTVIKHLSALSSLFRWCERQGYIADGANPVRDWHQPKRRHGSWPHNDAHSLRKSC